MRYLACLLLLLAVLPCLHAQDVPIHRCLGADGSPVFSDQPCAALHATPVQPAMASTTAEPAAGQAAVEPITCATSLALLRQRITDAFAAHDANQLAALMLWDGYGKASASAQIQSFTPLMRGGLVGMDAAEGDDGLVLHTATMNGRGEGGDMRFGVLRRSGCFWLRP